MYTPAFRRFTAGLCHMKRTTYLIIVAAFFFSASGCATFPSTKKTASKTSDRGDSSKADGDAEADDTGKEWDFVGREGRKDQAREKDPDPWFRKHLMSEKARSIENNLGID